MRSFSVLWLGCCELLRHVFKKNSRNIVVPPNWKTLVCNSLSEVPLPFWLKLPSLLMSF